jgi:hypothetical protein
VEYRSRGAAALHRKQMPLALRLNMDALEPVPLRDSSPGEGWPSQSTSILGLQAALYHEKTVRLRSEGFHVAQVI